MGPDDLHDLSQPLVHGPGVGLPILSQGADIQGAKEIGEAEQRPAALAAVGEGDGVLVIEIHQPLKIPRLGVMDTATPGQQVPQGAAVASVGKESQQGIKGGIFRCDGQLVLLSLGDIVCSTSLKVAGNRFTQLIIDYLRKYRKLAIGEQMAEEVKIRIGSALPLDEPLTMKVSGLALDSGLPVTIEVNSNEVESALRSAVDEIVRAVRTVLEITPPELAADIIQRGIVMTGGGSLLQNFDERLRSELQIPVYIAENALHCVVDGCSIMLEQLH